MAAKFQPLNAALHSLGLDALPVDRSVTTSLEAPGAACAVVLMNSCWGCGALEYIPEEFRQTVGAAIDTAIASGDPKVLRAYYDRQFDTPAFSDMSIFQLVEAAAGIPLEKMLVVVAHHNLLPQRLTRLAPYTELVNSGALRASLTEAKRPIVYLHGHIHTDPIEIMSIPRGDVLVSISAPKAEKGFNVLEIVFTRSGMPLAVHILPWSFDASGVLKQMERLIVPLIGNRRRSLDDGLAKIYSYLLATRQCYWADLMRECRPFFASNAEELVQECVELLVADHSVIVDNYGSLPMSWVLRAQI